MTVSSYLFQSPYPSAVQIGQQDPLSKEQAQKESSKNSVQEKSSLPQELKVNPTLSSNVSMSLIALSDSSGQKAADTFKTANTKVQAQSVYQNT